MGGDTWLLGLIALVAAVAVIVILIVVRLRRRYRAAIDSAIAVAEADGVIRPFEKGVYRGATAPGYPVVNNNGRIALTHKRLVFVTLTGVTIEIPLDSIRALRQATSFKSSVAGGYTHLVVGTAGGEIGFFVPDLGAWMRALQAATGISPAQS